jgi:hypothetical protein
LKVKAVLQALLLVSFAFFSGLAAAKLGGPWASSS